MKRILITTLSTGGHIPRYVRWILGCDAFVDAEVVVAGRKGLLNHVELDGLPFRGHCVCLSAKLETGLNNTSSTVALMRRQLILWRIWQQTFDEVNRAGQVDVVVMASADDCLDAIALKGSPFREAAWSGITLTPRFHFARMGVSAPKARFSGLRQWLFERALSERRLIGLFAIDPTLYEYANSYLRERRKVIFLHDPAVDHTLPPSVSARASLDISPKAKVVLIYGALSERKGITTLVECVSSSQCPPNLIVLLAGEQTPAITTFLTGRVSSELKRQNRLRIINCYLSDTDEARLLAATDCMWVCYRGFYAMSAMLVLAARHGIPCIVSRYGVIGQMMKKHKFGWIVDPESTESVLTALREVSEDCEVVRIKGQRGKLAFARHSIFEFQSTISRVIENACSRY